LLHADGQTDSHEGTSSRFSQFCKKREPTQLETHRSYMNKARRYMLLQKYSLLIVNIVNTLCGSKAKISYIKARETCRYHTALWVTIMFEHIQHNEHARDIIAKIILISSYVSPKG